MKRTAIALTLIMALLFSGVALTRFIRTTQARTIIVPNDYSTIQAAIDYASTGDTVFVRKGIYNETLIVNKAISLIGEDRDNTIINAQKAKCQVVLLQGNDITVANFTLGNNGYGPPTYKYWIPQNGEGVGINIDYNSNNNLVANNTIIGSTHQGIYIGVSKGNSIVGNTIIHSFEGIHIYGVENTIANNSFADVSQSIGFESKYLVWGDRTIENPYELAKDNFIQGNQNITLPTISSPFPSLLLNSIGSPVFILSPQNNTIYSSNNVTVIFSEPWGSVTFNQSLYDNYSRQSTQIYPTFNGSVYSYSMQVPNGNYSLVIEVARYPPFSSSQAIIGSSDVVNFVIMTPSPSIPELLFLAIASAVIIVIGVAILTFYFKKRKRQNRLSSSISNNN